MKNYTHTFIAHESQLEMIAIRLLGDRPTVGALYPQHHSHDGARPARGGYKKELDKYKKSKSDVCQVIQLFFQLRVVLQVAAGVGEEEEVLEPSRGQGQEEGLRGHEDERIAAILERIQAIKPEYKQRCGVFNSHHQHSSPSQVPEM